METRLEPGSHSFIELLSSPLATDKGRIGDELPAGWAWSHDIKQPITGQCVYHNQDSMGRDKNGQREVGVRWSPWFPRECSPGPGF